MALVAFTESSVQNYGGRELLTQFYSFLGIFLPLAKTPKVIIAGLWADRKQLGWIFQTASRLAILCFQVTDCPCYRMNS